MALPDFPEYPHGKFVVAAAAKGAIMNSVQARCAKAAKAAKNQTENKKKKKTKKKQLASAREAEGKGEEEVEEKEGDPPFGMNAPFGTNAGHGYNSLYTLGTTIASCTWSILSTDVSVAVAVFVVLGTVCCDQFC